MTEIYRDDHMVIRPHDETHVAIQVGRDPDEATPTIADAEELVGELSGYLHEQSENVRDSEDNSTGGRHE